jgi:oxygen-dependent protoporphyrinogen oxidase
MNGASGTARPDVEAIVIGAGAAGLGASLELQAQGREVLVLDAGDRPGGVMRSDRIEGFLVERGPSTTRMPAGAVALLQRAGLEAALVKASPESSARFLLRPEGLVPVPLSPLPFATTRLLSGPGKLRLLREPFVARGDGAGESVAAFVERRFGREVLEALIAPFLVGVYAGDEHALGAEAVFPTLVAAEREGGSIARGLLRRTLRGGGVRGFPGSWSAREGMGGLAALLARGLGERLQLGARVRALVPEGGGWRVELEARALRARRVVLAADAAGAAELLAPLDAEAAAYARALPFAPIVSVALALAPFATVQPIQGFGFLVPRDLGLDLLGALFMSRLFAGRAPAGQELVTAMIGGLRWPAALDALDDEVLRRVHAGLDRALGLRGTPRALSITRWARAVPQPGPDHVGAARAIRARLARLPGLGLAGACWDAVAVGEALAAGARAAAALLETSAVSGRAAAAAASFVPSR